MEQNSYSKNEGLCNPEETTTPKGLTDCGKETESSSELPNSSEDVLNMTPTVKQISNDDSSVGNNDTDKNMVLSNNHLHTKLDDLIPFEENSETRLSSVKDVVEKIISSVCNTNSKDLFTDATSKNSLITDLEDNSKMDSISTDNQNIVPAKLVESVTENTNKECGSGNAEDANCDGNSSLDSWPQPVEIPKWMALNEINQPVPLTDLEGNEDYVASRFSDTGDELVKAETKEILTTTTGSNFQENTEDKKTEALDLDSNDHDGTLKEKINIDDDKNKKEVENTEDKKTEALNLVSNDHVGALKEKINIDDDKNNNEVENHNNDDDVTLVNDNDGTLKEQIDDDDDKIQNEIEKHSKDKNQEANNGLLNEDVSDADSLPDTSHGQVKSAIERALLLTESVNDNVSKQTTTSCSDIGIQKQITNCTKTVSLIDCIDLNSSSEANDNPDTIEEDNNNDDDDDKDLTGAENISQDLSYPSSTERFGNIDNDVVKDKENSNVTSSTCNTEVSAEIMNSDITSNSKEVNADSEENYCVPPGEDSDIEEVVVIGDGNKKVNFQSSPEMGKSKNVTKETTRTQPETCINVIELSDDDDDDEGKNKDVVAKGNKCTLELQCEDDVINSGNQIIGNTTFCDDNSLNVFPLYEKITHVTPAEKSNNLAHLLSTPPGFLHNINILPNLADSMDGILNTLLSKTKTTPQKESGLTSQQLKKVVISCKELKIPLKRCDIDDTPVPKVTRTASARKRTTNGAVAKRDTQHNSHVQNKDPKVVSTSRLANHVPVFGETFSSELTFSSFCSETKGHNTPNKTNETSLFLQNTGPTSHSSSSAQPNTNRNAVSKVSERTESPIPQLRKRKAVNDTNSSGGTKVQKTSKKNIRNTRSSASSTTNDIPSGSSVDTERTKNDKRKTTEPSQEILPGKLPTALRNDNSGSRDISSSPVLTLPRSGNRSSSIAIQPPSSESEGKHKAVIPNGNGDSSLSESDCEQLSDVCFTSDESDDALGASEMPEKIIMGEETPKIQAKIPITVLPVQQHENKTLEMKYFECFLCDNTFTERFKLKNHFQSHVREIVQSVINTKQEHECVFCGKPLHSKAALKFHMTKKHQLSDSMKYACQFCSGMFASLVDLNEHVQSQHTSKLANSAQIPSSPLSSPKQQKNHNANPSPSYKEGKNKKRESSSSGESSSSDGAPLKSLIVKSHPGQRELASLKRKRDDVVEILEVSTSKSRKKKKRNASVSFIGEPSSAIDNKKNEISVTCSKCKKTYSSRDYLKRHMKKAHKSKTNEFTCKFCRQDFSTKQEMESHVAKEHSELQRPTGVFVCKVCSMSFPLESHLDQHFRINHLETVGNSDSSKRKGYTCPMCQKKCKTLGALTVHMQRKHPNLL